MKMCKYSRYATNIAVTYFENYRIASSKYIYAIQTDYSIHFEISGFHHIKAVICNENAQVIGAHFCVSVSEQKNAFTAR